MRPCANTLESELTQQERDSLITHLKSSEFRDKHLEIGTAAGGTLWEMMNSYDNTDRPQFVVIDPMKYFPDQLQLVKKNLLNHNIDPNSVDFRISTSHNAYLNAKRKKETFDFIFIDGAHKVQYVMEDLRWASMLNPNGLLCLHDFSPKYPGVWYSVNRFLRNNDNYEIISHVEKLLVVKKTEPASRTEVSTWDLAYTKILAPLYQLRASIRKRFK